MTIQKLHFLASENNDAQKHKDIFEKKYGSCAIDGAEAIIALGGDGFMLETMKSNMDHKLPIFGINHGSVGFLMNASNDLDLIDRVNASQSITISPLKMSAVTPDGKEPVSYTHLRAHET